MNRAFRTVLFVCLFLFFPWGAPNVASVSLLFEGVWSYHSKEILLGLGQEGVNSFLVIKAEGACDLFSRDASRE